MRRGLCLLRLPTADDGSYRLAVPNTCPSPQRSSAGPSPDRQLHGEQAWRVSGLGTPEDIDRIRRRITELEQTVVALTRQLEECGEELDAARAANREMIAQMNTSPGRKPSPTS